VEGGGVSSAGAVEYFLNEQKSRNPNLVQLSVIIISEAENYEYSFTPFTAYRVVKNASQ